MKYRWIILEKGATSAFNKLPSEQRKVGVPETEDDFFVHSRLFDGSDMDTAEGLVFHGITCLTDGKHLYPSLNELIEKEVADGGEAALAIMKQLREKMFTVYEALKQEDELLIGSNSP